MLVRLPKRGLPVQKHPGNHICRRTRATRTRLLIIISAVLLSSGCAASLAQSPQRHADSRVVVLEPFFAERIAHVAERSPSFRAAWELIQHSGVPVRIGTDEQLRGKLPGWYRDHPNAWAGVTVTETGSRDEVSVAFVALRFKAMKESARRTPRSTEFLLSEVDRVLIHEIYGHLVPVIATHNTRECLDQHGPGQPACVQLREQQIAAELSTYQLARTAEERGSR